MSYIPWDEIVDPRGLKIDFKNYVYYTVLVLIFYTPGYVDLEMKKILRVMREGVHLWRGAPRRRKWKMKSNFDFIFENLSKLKNCLPYGLLNFLFDMDNDNIAITKHRLGLSLKRLRRWSRQTKLCQGRCPVQAEPAGIRSSLRREERHSSFQIFIIIHS